MFEKLQFILEKIKKDKPLILNLTNYVSMDLMANCLLALGAAPIMSADERELEELTAIASAININIGTLNEKFVQQAHQVADYALSTNKPIILDPVGAGATKIRTQTALALLPKSTIVRGNASEIMALRSSNATTHGVEAIHSSNEAQGIATQIILQNRNLVIVISGAEDKIVTANQHVSLHFGSPIMTLVTGMGCTLTAVIAAFHAVCPDSFEAAALATTYFGLCGEQAAKASSLPGSFREKFINSLYAPDLKMMKNHLMEHENAM